VLYVPLLYGLGWMMARPLALIAPGLRPDRVDLVGAALALLLLLLSLPWRLRRVWGVATPWRSLGVVAPAPALLQALVRGVLEALAMLALVALGLMATGQAQWRGAIEIGTVLNALALLVGVGFAEELLFRGWLWGELQLGMGQRRALWLQAAVFSLVHPWMSVPGLGALGLLGGVFLLGVVLALQRRSDGGLLWGAVGLHGGLVGGWFVLQSGLLELSPQATAWLAGPGGARPNPIGGLLGILALGGLYLLLRKQSQGMA
jgi:uncharacterized protein